MCLYSTLIEAYYLTLHFMYTVNARLDVNVALNRPSYLSSTFVDQYGTFWASKGNDGDKTNCNAWTYSNSVAITHSESNPWFVVDLGVALHVAGVKLTNRADMAGKPGNGSLSYTIRRSHKHRPEVSECEIRAEL